MRKLRFVFELVAVTGTVLTHSVETRAQPLTIRTLAGNGTPGATNGFGSNARFSHPSGIVVDSAGNVYVADTENNTVRKITADGLASTFAGLAGASGSSDGPAAIARFYGPQAVAADNAGGLFVADTANGTIRQVTPTGVTSTFAGAPGEFNSFDGAAASARFYHSEGLAVGADGNLYVADTWNHTIRKLSAGGAVSTVAGLAGNFGAMDGTNSKARFNRPVGIAVDGATNLFVADSFNHTIRKITPAGSVTTIAGLAGVWGSSDGTNNSARFYLPQGIGIAANGDLFVADSGNQTVRKVAASGTNWVVSTVAGASGLVGLINGAGTNARFDFPTALALDANGSLYAADSANNTIRTTRIVPPTLQFTLAGARLVLSWPSSAEGFVLEHSPALGSPAVWSPATNGIVTVADNFMRTNALSGTENYRLHLP
jgi:sugar lactone lactonase YvrE